MGGNREATILQILRDAPRPMTAADVAEASGLDLKHVSTMLSVLYRWRRVARNAREYGVPNFRYTYWLAPDTHEQTGG